MWKKLLKVQGAMEKVYGTVESAVGSIFSMSEEHRRFLEAGYKCQRCNARLGPAPVGHSTTNYYAMDGRRLSAWLGGAVRADTVECPQCGHRWKLYGTSSVAPSSAIEEIVETHRSEEFFGEDRRVIDNSKSSTQLTRNFSVSKQWSKSCQLDFERTQSDGAELTIGAKEVTGLKLSSEEKLRRTYTMSQDTSETCTEEVSCEVPAHKKVTIAVRWKRIWQHGFVRATRNGTPLQIPFRVAVGVNFDQQQTDGE